MVEWFARLCDLSFANAKKKKEGLPTGRLLGVHCMEALVCECACVCELPALVTRRYVRLLLSLKASTTVWLR